MFETALVRGAAEIGLAVGGSQLELFRRFYELVRIGNEKINLTAITGEREAAVKHFVDSLTCLLVVNPPRFARLADVGSGAGFPGLVLKMARPDLEVTLVESVRKKAAFLQEAVRGLGLAGVRVAAVRAEELGREGAEREAYEVVTARGVASLPVVCEYCLPLVKVGGRFVSFKGPDVGREVDGGRRAAGRLGAELEELHPVTLPEGAGERVLVVFRKVGTCPAEYPRDPSRVKRRPLG